MGGARDMHEYLRSAQGILWENLKERNCWEELNVDESLILNWIIKGMLQGCRVLSYGLD